MLTLISSNCLSNHSYSSSIDSDEICISRSPHPQTDTQARAATYFRVLS